MSKLPIDQSFFADVERIENMQGRESKVPDTRCYFVVTPRVGSGFPIFSRDGEKGCHTSPVEAIFERGDMVHIRTRNSVYVLTNISQQRDLK